MADAKKLELGELTRMMEMLTQSTERLGRSYETIAKLQEQLAEKDKQLAKKSRLEMLGQMAAGLAHEIRNPLGGITLYANMLKRDLTGQADKVENLDKILGAVTNLDRLVEDMLTFGRDVEPQKTWQSVQAILDETLALTQLRGVAISRDAAQDAQAPVDAGMLQRVFLNLVLNAIQAMEKGGLLAITVHAGEDSVGIRFQDDGPGLTDPERIFTPFFTTKTKGTGLGLAIAQKIVEAHGGKITAANREEGGAEFVVQIPCPKS